MGPQRFGSMRHHLGRPAGGTTTRLTPFRDDTGLVALRYEQTKQAEPPIPLPPPRDPRRMSRAPSSATTASTAPTARSRSARSAPTSPVVVVPPPPPVEEHPFFRTTSISTKSSTTTTTNSSSTTRRRQSSSHQRRRSQEWKRDSGAPTSSTVTLREECAEADPLNLGHKLLLLDDIVADVPSVYSPGRDEIAVPLGRPSQTAAVAQPVSQSQPLSPSLLSSKSKSSKSKPPGLLTVAIPPRSAAAADKAKKAQEKDQEEEDRSVSSPTSSPTRRTSLARKLSRSFGIGPDGSKRLRKKMLGGDRAPSAAAAAAAAGGGAELPLAEQLAELLPQRPGPPGSPAGARSEAAAPAGAAAEPLRGSAKRAGATSKTPKQPKAPKSPKSPKPQKSPSKARHASQEQEQADASGCPLSGAAAFAPITTHIPDDNLWDDLGAVSFSKRGSIMFGGKNEGGLFQSLLAMSSSASSSPSPASPSPATAQHDSGDIDMDNNNMQSSSSPPEAAVPTADTSNDTNPTTDSSTPSPNPDEAAATTTKPDAIETIETTEANDTNEPKTTTANTTDNDIDTPAPAPAPADEPPRARPVPSIRVSSMDVERESQKVRSLYESGDGLNWEDGARVSYAERLEPTAEVPSDEDEHAVSSPPSDPPSASSAPLQPSDPSNTAPPLGTSNTPRSANSLSPLRDSQVRRDYERAGGIEDWADLDGVAVDRYGFISPKRPVSSAGTTTEMKSSRFSTARRRNLLSKRPSTSHASSTPHSTSLPGGFIRPPSRKVSARSLNTFTSELSTISRRSTRSSIRSATNRLPHNRDRRWMDEAGEMLSLQAGMTGITDDEKLGKTLEAQKRKEAERTEKWRKMATAIKSNTTTNNNNNNTTENIKEPQGSQSPFPQGQGVSYSFDTTSPKLIERTWKGIPDCWRSAAWFSFLSTSAERHGSSWARETEDYLTGEFRRLQAVASPDDVQIDLDVPRTVNGHIMFRRRYRGGQRLLFRVLHAISLYFPDTGYVQGMASLAATLLCYFDEERAFVMLVRMWRYRGLEGLYKPGFAGLMAALDEFEAGWLGGAGKEVKAKLNELAIDATAYGTRWYLTLFNLSIPFPAQLRVWDVFMLLGDCPPEPELPSRPSSPAPSAKPTPTAGDDNTPPQQTTQSSAAKEDRHPKGLSILHATSAALIHALRDVLLDADFENAMRSLTAWIPVRDEDLLMKVARAEWRRHQQLQQAAAAGGRRLWDITLHNNHGKDGKDNNNNNGGNGNNGDGGGNVKGKEGKSKEEKEKRVREEKERKEREKKEKEREKARERELREREKEIRELERARDKAAARKEKEREKGKGKEVEKDGEKGTERDGEKEKGKDKEKGKGKGILSGLVG